MRHEDGAILRDGQQVATTHHCPHCGKHFDSHPGSGILRRRGFCHRCMKVLCGSEACLSGCIPIEARLEFIEGTKTRYEDEIKALIASGAALL